MTVVDALLNTESEFEETMDELRLNEDIRSSARGFLAVLKQKSGFTYAHVLRVGLLARKIARFMHLDEKALFFAGIFHDLGKSQVPLSTLHKTAGWSPEDAKIMESHVIDSYRLLRDKFDFSAEIILWHHRFQKNAYPTELPPSLHRYSEGTKVLIQEYGRVLAIADVYDALHRKNNKFEEGESLTGEQIRQKMFEFNSDRKELIEELYNVGILERGVILTDTPDANLYQQAWNDGVKIRTPKETARLVMLSAALEPLSDKAGCTTRFTDVSRHLKLEYLVTGAINIGQAFEKLAEDADFHRKVRIPNDTMTGIYAFALLAQKESIRNRSGGRINQGIIELLLPIVTAQHYLDPIWRLTAGELLDRSHEILRQTKRVDVDNLIKMKKFAYNLCRYNDRPVPEYPEAESVFEYYAADLASSVSPTGIAHNGEFVNGFPTIKLMYDVIMNSSRPTFVKKVEEAYRVGLVQHDKNVGRGFLADCVAVAIYLCMSQNPRIQLVI